MIMMLLELRNSIVIGNDIHVHDDQDNNEIISSDIHVDNNYKVGDDVISNDIDVDDDNDDAIHFLINIFLIMILYFAFHVY